MIAALYVVADGPYSRRDDIDPWPESRDARLYDGPWPVVAHPPCERWGRYWSGGPSAKVRRQVGDDGGCFAAALASVRRWGGVLEHPEASHAWKAFDLPRPPRNGGWVRGVCGGWSCCVEQGHYGHAARKATWLYLHGVEEPPELIWGPAPQGLRLDQGYHSAEERRNAPRKAVHGRLSRRENLLTPELFAELLIGLARLSRPSRKEKSMPLIVTPTTPPTATRTRSTRKPRRFDATLAEITAVIDSNWKQLDVAATENGIALKGDETAADAAIKLAAAIREAGNKLPSSYYRAVALRSIVKFAEVPGKNPYTGRKKAEVVGE